MKNKLAIIGICAAVIVCQSFIAKDHDEKPTNLKILPKDISEEELDNVMHGYSKSLGVKCGFCHERKEGQHPDFASDTKPQKETARKMMLMVKDLNEKYMATMGDNHFEQITCVTCHMGRKNPMVSVDSLPKITPPQGEIKPPAGNK